jgi:hypothetical protein
MAGRQPFAHKTSGDDGYFILLACPAQSKGQKILPKDVAFVLDTSGPMAAKTRTGRKAPSSG